MRVPLLLVIGVFAPLVFGCGGDDGNEPEEARFLAVQNAQSGQLTARGEEYDLTLVGVDDQTVWFTDRPQHRAGSESTRDLLNDLFASAEGPPNAALVWNGEDGETTLVLELLGAAYDEELDTVVYSANILEQGDGTLAEFGASASVPTTEIESPALFIDSLFKNEVCELDIYNELHDISWRPAQAIAIKTFPGSETEGNGPPAGQSDDVGVGSDVSYAWNAIDNTTTCTVEVRLEITPLEQDTATVADFTLNNPSVGSNTLDLKSCDNFRCSWVTLSDSATYHVAFIVCEAAVSDVACKLRAGFGQGCELNLYDEIRPTRNGSLTASPDPDGHTIKLSGPGTASLSSGGATSWQWAGASTNQGCAIAVTIANGATGQTAIGFILSNAYAGGSMLERDICEGYQCAWEVIEDSANYRVAFVVCEAGTGFDACKARAGF